MQPIGNNGYTAEEVLEVLRGKRGPRKLSFRYELLDSQNRFLRHLDNVLDCEISQNALADIPRTARFTLQDDGNINYLSDRIKPWARLEMPRAEETYEDIHSKIPNLILRYKCDEAPESTTAVNSAPTGSQYDAELGGVDAGSAPLFQESSRSWRFTSADLDAIAIPDAFTQSHVNLARRLTISFWVKFTGNDSWDFIIDSTDSTQHGGISIFKTPSNALAVNYNLTNYDPGGFDEYIWVLTPQAVLSKDRVYHVLVTWGTNQELKLFLNGQKQELGSGGLTRPVKWYGVLDSPSTLYIGRWRAAQNTDWNLDGWISDISFWDAYVDDDSLAEALYFSGLRTGKYGIPGENYAEWPQGVFLLTSPVRRVDENGTVTREVEGYDACQVFADDLVTERFTAVQGDKYTEVISGLLGNVPKSIQGSDLTIPVSQEWEPGTSKLTIINELLDAINYERLHFDENGVAICRKYVSPQDRGAEFVYRDDEDSVTLPEVSQELDLFGVPNKWVLVVSHPEREPMASTIINDDPGSITSTVSRGRTIVDFRLDEDAPDQATLDERARRIALEASQVFEHVEFDTAIMPFHGHNDVYQFAFQGLVIDDKYAETEWSYRLAAGEPMRHKIRRVVILDVEAEE